MAQGETISLYPAVIAALVDNNPGPLRTWSNQVANLQGTSVTVTDAAGRVVSRGHAPEQSGDDLSGELDGLRMALSGQEISGVESGDELGPALRGYVPVRQDGLSGPIVGAVMIADPLDDRFLARMTADGAAPSVHLDTTPDADGCTISNGLASTCHVALASPTGEPVASVAFDVPLQEVEGAQADAQRGLWLVSLLVLAVGAVAAWLVARSLTGPLAHLTAASQRIAGGSFDQPVNVGSRDEIGSLATAFEQMRQRVAEMTERLRDERDVLDAVLDSTGDGILMVDTRGQTVVANHVWAELAGDSTLAAAASLRSTEDPEITFGLLSERWQADAEHVAAAEFERNEPYQCLRVYSAPVRFHGEGPILGRIFVLRDVTRETEAERMRSALLATVSHELRSPLTAISGYTDTLLHDGPWDDRTQREFLEVIALSASRLSALVDNLLDAATLDAGVLELEREPVRVERVAERVLAQRRLLATSWTLHLETRPGLPLGRRRPDSRRAGAGQSRRQRDQVLPQRWPDPRARVAHGGRPGGRERLGSRHRHPARSNRPPVRALLSCRGRRRRSEGRRAGPVHLQEPRRSAWRPHLRREHARCGQHVFVHVAGAVRTRGCGPRTRRSSLWSLNASRRRGAMCHPERSEGSVTRRPLQTSIEP